MRQLQEEAWVGDAVLSLFARCHILDTDGTVNAERCSRMTSNQFLSAFGQPTAVEARIGRIYQKDGLDAAFTWIRAEILPRFLQRESQRELALQGGRPRPQQR
jgi:dsRNA-specific ribonuclease